MTSAPQTFRTWLRQARQRKMFGGIVDFGTSPVLVRDFTRAGTEEELPPNAFDVGKYNERRTGMYETELFKDESNQVGGYAGKRMIHIGLDIGGKVGTPVCSFADGVVLHVGYNAPEGDYGHVIVTQHTIPKDVAGVEVSFFALYGHLSARSTAGKHAGQSIKRGDVIGYFGDRHENGNWPPHVHFQLSTQRPETHDMPGVVSDNDHAAALEMFPDPRLVLGDLYIGQGSGVGGLWEDTTNKHKL
eukprot:m.15888 g.15888  ORF g.15888 m.15888 type:complete len:245 (-) comp10776_c0_seq1:70-804(-)